MAQHPAKPITPALTATDESPSAFLRPRPLVRFSPRTENQAKSRLWALEHPRIQSSSEGPANWLSAVTGWLKR